MLSVTEPIQVTDIESVTCLADNHPVFLLEGSYNDKVVVKREEVNAHASAKDLSRNGRVMGAVSPGAQAFVAAPSEVKAMEFWAKGQFAHADTQQRKVLNDFLADIRTAGAWVKMRHHFLLDLAHAKNKLAAQDKSEVREMAKVLNAPGAIEKLGQIIVGDIFNGNQDRFAFRFPFKPQETCGGGFPKGADPLNPNRVNFWHLLNYGNIMVTRGKGASPIGLDSWDPTSYFNDWQQSLSAAEGVIGETWAGKLLAPNQLLTRKKIAERCVEDLNFVLGERNRRLPIFSKLRLNKNAADRMAQGMETGITLLKNMLRTRYNGRTPPQGLRDRCTVLGFTI